MAEANHNVTPLPHVQINTANETVKELPHNVPAEQSFLGALLLDNGIIDRLDMQLRPDHFYDPVHSQIYEAAMRMIARGQLASPVTLSAFFNHNPAFDDDGADGYLNDLVDGVISTAGAGDYARVIHEAFLRRALVRIADQVSFDAQNPDLNMPAETQIEAAEQHLFNLAENDRTETGLQDFSTVLTQTVKIAEAAAQNDAHLSGVSTGLTSLNNLLGGLHRSDLVILAGRPAMGKTALATNIAFHAATTTKTGEKSVPVAFFSLEMSAEQLGMRILAERSNIDSESIRRGKLDETEFMNLITASDSIATAPFYIDDTPALSVSQMASRARRLKRTSGLGLVVVDYLQLLHAQFGVKPENRVQELSNISRALKSLAKELDVPILALSQLSRAVEQREDKRPTLADLRESGSIEQDADVVMFVYRDEYYLSKNEPEHKESETSEKYEQRYQFWQERLEKAAGVAEIIVGKQRHGPVGSVPVAFEGRLTKFSDLASSDHLPEHF